MRAQPSGPVIAQGDTMGRESYHPLGVGAMRIQDAEPEGRYLGNAVRGLRSAGTTKEPTRKNLDAKGDIERCYMRGITHMRRYVVMKSNFCEETTEN